MHAYITNLTDIYDYRWLEDAMASVDLPHTIKHDYQHNLRDPADSIDLPMMWLHPDFPHELDRSEDSTWQGGPGHIYTACFAVVDTLGLWSSSGQLGRYLVSLFPPFFIILLAISFCFVGSHVLLPCAHRSPSQQVSMKRSLPWIFSAFAYVLSTFAILHTPWDSV